MDLLRLLSLFFIFGAPLITAIPTTMARAVPPGCGVFVMENGDLVRMYTYPKGDAEACQEVYNPNDPTIEFVSYQVYPACSCDIFLLVTISALRMKKNTDGYHLLWETSETRHCFTKLSDLTTVTRSRIIQRATTPKPVFTSMVQWKVIGAGKCRHHIDVGIPRWVVMDPVRQSQSTVGTPIGISRWTKMYKDIVGHSTRVKQRKSRSVRYQDPSHTIKSMRANQIGSAMNKVP